MHNEADWYIVDHLSDKPFLVKMICPDGVDAGDFMGRPVSHLLEYVDSHIIYWLYLAGYPSFTSVITIALLASASILFFALGLRTGVDRWILLLLVTLYWTDPNVFLTGFYCRDAKPAAGFFVFCAVFLMLWNRRDPTERITAPEPRPPAAQGGPSPTMPSARPRVRRFFWYFLLAAGACFSDLQGVFMIVMLAGLCLGWSVILRDLELAFAGVGGVLAAACQLVYLFVVGPWLVYHFAKLEVTNTFQFHMQDPGMTPVSQNLWDGLMMNAQIVAFWLGNLSPVIVLPLIGAGVVLTYRVRPFRKGLILGSTFVILLAGSVLMWARMIGFHPPLMFEDVKRTFYAIPTVLLWLALLPPFLKIVMNRFQVKRAVVITVLAVLVLLNANAIQSHIATFKSGHLHEFFAATPVILDDLRDKGGRNTYGSALVKFLKK